MFVDASLIRLVKPSSQQDPSSLVKVEVVTEVAGYPRSVCCVDDVETVMDEVRGDVHLLEVVDGDFHFPNPPLAIPANTLVYRIELDSFAFEGTHTGGVLQEDKGTGLRRIRRDPGGNSL